jgi:hypothetical protein
MLSDHLKLAPLLTALGIVSCGGHALIPPPPAGSPECEDSGGWTLCSDGKWHNGEDILPALRRRWGRPIMQPDVEA